MTLKRLFGIFSLLFVVTQFAILGLSLTGFYSSAKTRFASLQAENLDYTFELHKSQLIGNILLKDHQLTQELLQRLSEEREIFVQLKGPIEFSAGPSTLSSQDAISKTYPLSYAGEQLGELTLKLPIGFTLTSFSREVYGILLAQALFVVLAFIALRFLLKTRLFQPIGELASHFVVRGSVPIELHKGVPTELKLLNSNYNLMQDQVRANQEKLIQNERDRTLVQIAAQVSHDIRSPLAALDTAYSMAEGLSESSRVLIRMAISRIRDIANELLSRSALTKAATLPPENGATGATPQLIGSLIETIISEKRLEFRSSSLLEINWDPNFKNYGVFAAVQPNEFRRVVSNLLNNSIEAVRTTGKVEVTLKGLTDSWIEVTISDDGPGISPDILSRLGSERISTGKTQGNGLGIPHALMSVKAWGGDLRFHSQVGTGTRVTLSIPKSQSPSWFLPAISVSPGREVIILDDDPSIHQVWAERLTSLIRSEAINLFHFRSAPELARWIRSSDRDLSRATYLFDYELIMDGTSTGLSLMEELEIGPQAVLVTSYFNDPELQSRVVACGAKLLPKAMAAFIPIRTEPSIDDSPGNFQAAKASGERIPSDLVLE